MTNNKAILYLRSSKDRSDVSIDAQRRALHDVAATRNLVVVDEYADAVESGKDEDRPGFQRLLQQIKSADREWQHILVLDTSRVARRRMIALLFEQECKKRDIRVIYRNVPETDAATEMLLKSVLQAMDEWHSLNSRQKGLAGMAENVRQGWRAGGRAPRGYKLAYHSTGAVRDGSPVLKSKLEIDESCADAVRAYLELRAQGIARGPAVARLNLQWPPSSAQSMDWQALTYAGHTVWNMHAERQSGNLIQEKRRPRSEWLMQRNTHPALITDEQAETILAEMERGQQGRRNRSSSLLLTGLLETPDGAAWHSDGCGFYRVGKGRKVHAGKLEETTLGIVLNSLCSDAAVLHLISAMRAVGEGEPIDGRKLAGISKRIASLSTQIAKTVDLAAQMDDPAPVLRRVSDLENQRAQLVDELAALEARQDQQVQAVNVDEHQVRALLRRLFEEIKASAADEELRASAKLALQEAIERITLCPESLSLRVHFAVNTGDILASPRGGNLSPVRWASEIIRLPQRRRA
jgi:DNA invertase Pin-like site-specific DNA recombinase